ncbi:MAG: hypothetical protein Q7K55_04395 [Candidatus Levybacteria bacterium]|nr:hypothetical protein [Candidatus Levybacteria bacterium]
MGFYLTLPLDILKFWYLDAPRGLISFFASLNSAFFKLFSLPLLLKTYFRPWKNEYRKGLVGFSIGMGMFIKTFVILADTILFILLLLTELVIILGFLLWPLGTILLLIMLIKS